MKNKKVLCLKYLVLFSSFKVCLTSLVISGTETLEKIHILEARGRKTIFFSRMPWRIFELKLFQSKSKVSNI